MAVVSRIANSQNKLQPFYAEQTLVDYRTGNQSTRIVVRRSDGAVAIVQSIVMGKADYPFQSAAYARELVLTDGRSFRLVDALRAKSTWPPLSEVEKAIAVKDRVDPLNDCGMPAGAKVIGRDIVESFEAAIVQATASDGRKMNQWLVPALGCMAMRSIIQMAPPNGPPSLVFETKLTRIRLGEPEGKYFSVGGDYQEMRPSSVIDLQESNLHIESQDRGAASLDRKYKGFGK